jgi:hypothetical protein
MVKYFDLTGQQVAVFEYTDLEKFVVEPKNRRTLDAIIERHNNRFNFDGLPLNVEFVNWLNALSTDSAKIFLVIDPQKRIRILSLIVDSIKKAFMDKNFSMEMAEWTRPSFPKYRDGLPGYNLNLPYLISFFVPWMIRHFNMGSLQAALYKPMLSSASAFVCICTPEDDKLSWLKSGELMHEIWVKAQEFNIKLGIMAASIETADDYKQLMDILGTNLRPQVFMRLGYTSKVPKKAPRLNLDELIVK